MTHHKAMLDTNKSGFYPWQQNKQLLVQKRCRPGTFSVLPPPLLPRLLSLSISMWTNVVNCVLGKWCLPHTAAARPSCAPLQRWLLQLWLGSDREPCCRHTSTDVPLFSTKVPLFFFLLSAAQVPSARFVSSPLGFRFEEQEEGLFLRVSSPLSFFILLNYTACRLQTGRLELIKEFVFSVAPNRMPYIARLLIFLSDSITSQRKFE